MTVFTRRVAGFAALALLAAALAGCGDSEADQRKAFIGFLQGGSFAGKAAAKVNGPFERSFTLLRAFA